MNQPTDKCASPGVQAALPCDAKRCCVPPRLRAGRAFCATVCVCLLCASKAQGQPAEQEHQAGAEGGEERPAGSPTASAVPPPPPPTQSALSYPRVVHTVDAVYPPSALKAHRQAVVELLVTVLADGTVGEVSVAQSGDPQFDVAATNAVRQWRFVPATRAGQPVDSRIRVPFRFALPVAEQVASPRPKPSQVRSASPPRATTIPRSSAPRAETLQTPVQVFVQGERQLRTERRSSSDYLLHRDVVAAAPHQEGADVLRAAPGLYIGRGEGPAVAHNYLLRGFDADHGQDIEFRVGGLPINLPAHIHGQGYSDVSFLLSDVVQTLEVSEGVYDPRQGDFAVAGTIDVSLGVAEGARGVHWDSSFGAFNSWRQRAVWAPRTAPDETFGAVQFSSTDGFGENRAAQTGTGIFQHRFGEGDLRFRALGIVHSARGNLAGVVRTEDVNSGQVCFECVYPYPTAQGQNALSQRLLVGLFADSVGEEGSSGQFGIWFGYDNFRLQENFTGFIQQSRQLERIAGRGDLIEQRNNTTSLGLTSRYRMPSLQPLPWAHGHVEVGADARLDLVGQQQNLLDATVRNQTWDRRVDSSVRGVDFGFWGDTDWTLTPWIHFRAGLRADVLSYDIEDRLGNFAPLTRPQDGFITGFRRSALGVAAGPRTSVELVAAPWVSVLAAYGEGYRSPQARLLEDGETAPFSKVRSADIGLRFDWDDPLQLTLTGYYTHLSDDIAFEAAEGRMERIGATRRMGTVIHALSRPTDWLVSSTSLTFVDAELLEPSPQSADDPQPPFVEGQNLPFVPPVVIRTDLGARSALLDRWGGYSLVAKAGLGFSFLSSRPLPYGQFAAPLALLDASAGLSWGALHLNLEAFNLLDTQYAAVEYSLPSDWDPTDGFRSRTPTRHTAAGSPLSWMLSAGVDL